MAGFFQKFRQGITKTRTQVFDKISYAIHAKKKIDEELLEEIEDILISGDVGPQTTLTLLDRVKARVRKEKYEEPEKLFRILEEEVAAMFPAGDYSEESITAKPFVIMVVGVNGVGKTTTIAKLANRFKEQGKSVLLAAGDTFRAAAIDQLQVWADRVEVDLVKHQPGSDPGAVIFDALAAANARGHDVVIADTAGRLHNKVNLMDELGKISRVAKKVQPDAPHINLLVLDGTVGQNALNQAKQFIDAAQVNGLVLTKLDGTAKGGAIIGVSHQLNLPVYYIGVGEKMDDLQPFDATLFARSLFEQQN